MSLNPAEEVKQRLDVAEVIGEYVSLRPAGKYLKALCPIHHEKTPSFMVDRSNGIWHCFSFIEEMEGMDFPETLRLLAKKANVELPRYDPKLQSERTKLADIIRTAAAFYHETFKRSGSAESVRAYVRERGISDLTVDTFKIGYAPDAWDTLLSFLRSRNFRDEDIFQAGLTIRKEKGVGFYDRFRNRLMFPISDQHGTIIGFGGRVLPGAPDDSAKYINSPQSELYNKSQVVYGLDRAKQSIRRNDAAIVVEGYMDVIASHQAGVENVVAASGTAFTLEQLKLLKRYTSNLLLAFDADVAGEGATRRGIELALQEELNLRIIRIPEGKDPDELIRRDPESWKGAITRAERFMDDAFARTFERVDLKDVDGKKQSAAILLPLIAKVKNPVEQTHYLQKLAEAIRVSEEALRTRITPGRPAPKPSAKAAPAVAPRTSRAWKLSQLTLAILLRDLSLLPDVAETLVPEVLDEPFRGLYKILLDRYSESRTFTLEDVLTFLKANRPEAVNDVSLLLLLAEQHFPEESAELLKAELARTVKYLLELSLDRAIADIRADLQTAEAANDQDRVATLLERFTTLTEQRTRLTR
jgi:DNA primase